MNVSQHATWERLLMNLETTQSLFQQFLHLLFTEERHLQILNRQGLNEINSQKEDLLDVLLQIEQQVERDLQQLSEAGSSKARGKFLSTHPDPRAQTASAILNNLVHLAGTIQDQGKKNEARTSRIQGIIREAISFMHAGLGAGPVYQGSGSLNFPTVPSSVHLQG